MKSLVHVEQWRKNLFTAWFTQILSLTGFGFAFPFLPLFIQDLGVTDPDELRVWTSVIASAPALSMGIMAPIWGLVADRLGKKIMILRAMLFGAVVSGLLAFSQSATTVLVLRFVQGLFTGTVSAAAALVATGTPRHKLSYALGFLSSSTFIGISVGPLIGGVTAEIAGYRVSFLIGSAVLAVGFVLALLLIVDPERAGAGANAGGSQERAKTPSVKPDTRTEDASEHDKSFRVRSFLTPAFVASFAVLFVLRFCRVITVPFIPLHVQDLRATADGTSAAVGFVSAARGAATALAGLTLSRLGDKRDRMKLITLFLAAAAVFSVPVFLADGMFVFVLFNLIFTYFLGGVEPLLQSSLAEITPSNRRGLLFGIQTTVGNVGWFLGPLAGGAVSVAFSTRHVFAAATAAIIVGIGVSVVVQRRLARVSARGAPDSFATG